MSKIITKITSNVTGLDMDIEFAMIMMGCENHAELIEKLENLDTVTFEAKPIVYLKKI